MQQDPETFFEKIKSWWREEYKFGESLLGLNNNISGKSFSSKKKIPVEFMDPVVDPKIWTKERIDICRDFWEEDYFDEIISFEAPSFAVNLTSYLNLSSGTTILDMFSGIGGAARLISKKLDLWVTCMEMEQVLVDMANDLSKSHDLDKKVISVLYNPDTVTLSENKYVACLLRERFHSIENKVKVLNSVFSSLQEGGHIIITDFFAKDVTHPDIVSWKEVSSYNVYLWTVDQYIDAMQSANFRFHVKKDHSEEILNRFNTQWEKFFKNFSINAHSPNTLRYIENELSQWSRIHNALKNGNLTYIRLHGSKG